MLPFFVLIYYVCKLSLTSQFGNKASCCCCCCCCCCCLPDISDIGVLSQPFAIVIQLRFEIRKKGLKPKTSLVIIFSQYGETLRCQVM